MGVTLRRSAPPSAHPAGPQPSVPPDEYEQRIRTLYAQAAVDWVVVYADREHMANLAFLCGFDPRFEEAALLIGPAERRVLLVGNEGLGHAVQATVRLDVLLAQSFSLMGQSRSQAPRLRDSLRRAGIDAGATIGVVGWKYLEPEECDDPAVPAFIPALLANALAQRVGPAGSVIDITALLMHPAHGLRTQNSAAQIAMFEWAAAQASDAVLRIVQGARPGQSERQAAAAMGYAGDPLSCHVMLVSGDDGALNGLRSPSARVLNIGDGVTTAAGYWGGLACRAGLLRDTPDPSFLSTYVEPYFQTIATWYQAVKIGVSGGEVYRSIQAALSAAPFGAALNPGHLTSFDEWLHTPIRAASNESITSGMLFQCDIIPTPLPPGTALNCEDTIAVADVALQAELKAAYPELWARITARRQFMRDVLGIALPDEVLPLSSAPAYLPPFWLASDLICTLAPTSNR